MVEIMELDLQPFRQNLLFTDEKIAAAARKTEEDEDGPSVADLQRIKSQLQREIHCREIEFATTREENRCIRRLRRE